MLVKEAPLVGGEDTKGIALWCVLQVVCAHLLLDRRQTLVLVRIENRDSEENHLIAGLVQILVEFLFNLNHGGRWVVSSLKGHYLQPQM